MIELKGSSARGKQVIAMGEACKGHTLRDIYCTWSPEKERYYNVCYNMYLHTANSSAFRVKACGSWSFVASWYGIADNELIMRVETRDNSYLVWLDR